MNLKNFNFNNYYYISKYKFPTNYRIIILLRKHSDMSSDDISIMKYQKSNISIKKKYFIFKYIFIKRYIVEHVRIDYETNSLE